ncbi:MAG TPA: hypothetical protein EYQ69_06690, partial [Gemmatimonadetes bacterium]|nr:hypothetical protein [Gemmatimonadota bacterium]
PGLKGLWRFHEDNLVLRERVKMDLAYVRNYSVFLDIKIMFQTMFLVWRRWATADESLSRWMSSEED